jgi:hypothetical protein
MDISNLTITGADESVDPKDLFSLTLKYPFVEWGILLSKANEGKKPCYPGVDWIYEFGVQCLRYRVENGEKDSPASCHLCGKWAEDLIAGGNLFWDERSGWLDRFHRMQINTAGRTIIYNDEGFIANLRKITSNPLTNVRHVIIQMDGVNDRLYGLCCDTDLDVSPLFDKSYGLGKLPNEWPKPCVKYQVTKKNSIVFYPSPLGYAGGLNPDNLEKQIEIISGRVEPCRPQVWLDMQSGVRSDEGKKFDLAKAEACLKIVAAHRG